MKKTIIIFCLLSSFSTHLFSQKEPVRINGRAQGVAYNITYFDKKNRDFTTEIEKLLKDFDKSVSLWDSTSIISRVNNNDKNVILDDYFKVCFNKCLEVSKATDGAFDCTVGPLVKGWGFSFKKKAKMDSTMVDSLLKFIGYQYVEMKDGKIIKKDNRITLDFNALAQGYSVDLVSKLLESKKISSYLVEIGGEVFARGKKPNGDNWKVGIEKPIDNPDGNNPLKAIARIEDKAFNTSGNYRKFYIENGIRYSHEINPKTGYPAHNSLLSATVLANDCMTADAYATAFMVMGLEKSITFLSEHSELMAYLIYSDEKGNYKVFQSDGLNKIITDAVEE
ncbi:MAG: FAD:protein FMN transferase [Bacteroidetes bacterium]|nr:FAD:protein FMN transferase [Bacteroidota bacterium]